MFNRQDYVCQSSDPKGDEGFGKLFGIVICFVFFLGALQVAYETVSAWYQSFMQWGSEILAFLTGFWPF
ncbi:MAG: hypothetical protein E5W93_02770 [Mesorhizobium sp.]|nr:MAG: hypothetical protein E5W93_02770 [Mesorhizobium sp.]